MAKFLFVRHGQANYDAVDERNFIGQGRDLAPLTALGVEQIIETSKDPRLKAGSIIITSPYTRALQSAAIISKAVGVDLKVEVGLHEWVPDIVNFQHKSSKECSDLAKDFALHEGVHPKGQVKVWETSDQMKKRMDAVLEKYNHYHTVVVVCHGMVIRTQVDQEKILNGEIIE